MGSAGGWEGLYLAVKRTCRTMEVGGALTERASSSPLLGKTLNAAGSWSSSFWPTPRGRENTRGRQLLALPQEGPSLQKSQVVSATFLGARPSCTGEQWAARTAWPTHQHGPVAPAATQVHQVDLPDSLLVHKAGPKIHPAGGELQLGHSHGGLQGHHLRGQSR